MVYLLKRFVEEAEADSDVMYDVHVDREIWYYKRMQKESAIIVFDFNACYNLLVEEQWELVCGGRHTQAMQRAEIIFQKLIALGAKLVYFLEGPRKIAKLEECIRRSNDKYNQYIKLHKLLPDGLKYEHFKKLNFNFMASYFENFYIMAKKYGEIHISFDNECDVDLAAYATKNNVLAVFADDTDFLIMQGDWSIWSPRNFNIDKLTTTGWNKKKLRDLLNLRQSQMPIFSTLCGNVYIPYLMLKSVHRLLGGDKYLFHSGLAKYIRTNFPLNMPITEADVGKISNLIYNSAPGKSLQEVQDLVKISLDFYDYAKRKNAEIEPMWLKQHINETHSIFIYMIIKSIPLTLFNSLIDLSNKEITPYKEFILPMISRMAGVILYEKREEKNDRFVLMKLNHHKSTEVQKFSPIFPDFTIPVISSLTDKFNFLICEKEKIEILLWIMNKKLSYSKVTDICGSKYLMPCLALYFLVQVNHITIDEADVCLLSSIENNLNKNLNKKPNVIYARPHYLAIIYSTIIYSIRSALFVCGLGQYVHERIFDAYFFHNFYAKYNIMSPGEKVNSLRAIEKKYRIYSDN